MPTSLLTDTLVPTRSTSYTHLRDAFIRALRARMLAHKKAGTISPDEEDVCFVGYSTSLSLLRTSALRHWSDPYKN